jgi:hypothetical protein
MDNNVTFYMYKETIRDNIVRTLCIQPHMVEAYKAVVHFKEGHHHMYVQAKKDPDRQWLRTQYKLTEEDMGHIMVDWDDEWKIPLTEVEPSTKKNPKVHEIDEEEEGGDDHDRGKGLEEKTQQTIQ